MLCSKLLIMRAICGFLLCARGSKCSEGVVGEGK